MVIRALIVDDSALIRKVLSDILNQDPKIAVIGTAINGEDGLEKVRKLKPDVVLLDNIMPVLDGLKTLSHIMEEFPTPVVIVSALGGEKAEEITLTALEYGAVDVIEKLRVFSVKVCTRWQKKFVQKSEQLQKPILITLGASGI